MSDPAVQIQPPIVVTHEADGIVDVQPRHLPVSVEPGDTVVLVWQPGQDTEITLISGFNSSVTVVGPHPDGTWTATYTAPADKADWHYNVTTDRLGEHGERHDPEIDNTPPVQGG